MRINYLNLFLVSIDEETIFDQYQNSVLEYFGKEYKNTDSLKETKLQVITNGDTFLVSNVTGYVLLRLAQIVYFEYNRSKRLWEIVLSDNSRLQLKKKTNAEMILGSSTEFMQLNLHHIINHNHFSHISDNLVFLNDDLNKFGPFKITRYHLRMLQERYINF